MTVGIEYKSRALSKKDETIHRLVNGGRASGLVIGEGCRARAFQRTAATDCWSPRITLLQPCLKLTLPLDAALGGGKSRKISPMDGFDKTPWLRSVDVPTGPGSAMSRATVFVSRETLHASG